MLLKKEMTASFLWKIHGSKHQRFLKKRNVHLEGECDERFSQMPNELKCLHDWIKIAIFETMV